MSGYTVVVMTARAAERHDRRAMNIPADVSLGWSPYTVRVSHRAISHAAFHRLRELRRWMKGRYRLVLAPRSLAGVRYGTLEETP